MRPTRRETRARRPKGRYAALKDRLDAGRAANGWAEVDTAPPAAGGAYNFVDLFSGCGGLSSGFAKARFSKVMSVELDPDASATIRRNWPSSVHFEGDIRNLTDGDMRGAAGGREVHVVAGGPPCNGFSVAGRRDPEDERNFLYREFLRAVRLFRPWVVMMENVPGILTMDRGRFLKSIKRGLALQGYGVSVRILEAADFHVPQWRARAILVANRFGVRNRYPRATAAEGDLVPIERAIGDLAARGRDPSINHEWTRHSKEFTGRIAKVPPGGSLYATFRDAYKRQVLGAPSMTIKENHGGTHIHPFLDRTISAREMARLQTFDDSFLFEGRMKRVMWQVGNAVPVRMAEHIAKAIRTQLKEIRATRRPPQMPADIETAKRRSSEPRQSLAVVSTA